MDGTPTHVRVFVVEDSALLRERIVADILSLGTFDVVGVADTEADAFAGITKTCPEIVVTDLMLREGSGIGVVRRLRNYPDCPPLQIFVLSNYATAEYKRAILMSGANDFFDKSSEYSCFLSAMSAAAKSVHKDGGRTREGAPASTCDGAE